jgi:hypothetical protein
MSGLVLGKSQWYGMRVGVVGQQLGCTERERGAPLLYAVRAHPRLAEAASSSALATASGTVVRTVARRCCGSPALVGASTRVDVRLDIRK